MKYEIKRIGGMFAVRKPFLRFFRVYLTRTVSFGWEDTQWLCGGAPPSLWNQRVIQNIVGGPIDARSLPDGKWVRVNEMGQNQKHATIP